MCRFPLHAHEPINWFSRLCGVPDGTLTVQDSPLDSFALEDDYSSDGSVCKHFTTDLRLILNQERISRDLLPVIDDILKNARTSDVSDKFAGLTDDQLLSCVKSRYLQAPCEIKAWTEYLTNELKAMNVETETETSNDVSDTSSDVSNTSNDVSSE